MEHCSLTLWDERYKVCALMVKVGTKDRACHLMAPRDDSHTGRDPDTNTAWDAVGSGGRLLRKSAQGHTPEPPPLAEPGFLG